MRISLNECVIYSENAIDFMGSVRRPHPLLSDISYLASAGDLSILDDVYTPRLIRMLQALNALGYDPENDGASTNEQDNRVEDEIVVVPARRDGESDTVHSEAIGHASQLTRDTRSEWVVLEEEVGHQATRTSGQAVRSEYRVELSRIMNGAHLVSAIAEETSQFRYSQS